MGLMGMINRGQRSSLAMCRAHGSWGSWPTNGRPYLAALLVATSITGCAEPTNLGHGSSVAAAAAESSTRRKIDPQVQLAAHRVVDGDAAEPLSSATVPAWAADAVFYQIFTERFANGDPKNDPTRESLESPDSVPKNWKISPWTGDWYARADWERERGPNFFENGVFDRRYGGDLQGVINKLDYLAGLGINTIYFNPVFYARSLHKYDGSSFHHIDPYFGPDPAGDLS